MAQQVEKRKVCKCENCGNEAEMVLTCSLEAVEAAKAAPSASPGSGGATEAPPQVKAKGTCAHCGNEADMWIDV